MREISAMINAEKFTKAEIKIPAAEKRNVHARAERAETAPDGIGLEGLFIKSMDLS